MKRQMGRHSPLARQLSKTRETGVLSRKSIQSLNEDVDDEKAPIKETLLSTKETEKILKVAKAQIDEHRGDDTHSDAEDDGEDSKSGPTSESLKRKKKEEVFQIQSANISLQDILGDDDGDLESTTGSMCPPPEIELTEQEERALDMFMPKSSREQVSLHDIIMKRVSKKEDDNISLLDPRKIIQRKIPKRVIAVYVEVGRIAQNWRSGKFPKALKLIPQLQDWEELLYITNPDGWSPNVVYQMTKQFVSQSNNPICQRYFNTVLLQMVRDDILVNKKLNFHLYQAVKKALFKPKAFFRGFLLPLCSDMCRGREAVIIGSVLAKNSIPVIHSALAIYKLMELEYSGSVHYILKILLNKRYAMPLKVLAALVEHFKKFEKDPRQMTVVWHQTLLVFAERYKKALTKEQRHSLKTVLKRQYHPKITPLIRKELYENVKDKITSMDIDI